ncbi:hypothetical protein SUGI_0838720 [Cryptomeria japonica]|uniref:4,5-DOPA dioxygenase extradiol-like n=1 Tax=Cryptomeria japonica TaxID=3369 RepID=UPI002414CDDF|nr:4,5-DOPA dioxygenase extradiol-like [Cryptomeria japonica]GLJ40633.1 hypothetical protein SUGI_0838720 [Cryptomeria japonica]
MADGNSTPICELEDEWIDVGDEGSNLVDGWMYVDGGVNGQPTVVELTQEDTHLGGVNTKAYCCFCNVMPKDLIQILPKMSGRPRADLLIVTTRQASETQTRKQDLPGFLSQLHCEVKATDERSDALADRVKELLMRGGVKNVRQKTFVKRAEGGAQSTPSVHNYISDIALCQLSVQAKRDATFHYNLGRALAPLKHEGVVILGICNNVGLTHLQTSSPPLIWAEAFDKWLSYHLLHKRFEEIIQFENSFPHASNVQWLAERLYPLLVALGAAGEGAIAERLNDGWSFSSQS